MGDKENSSSRADKKKQRMIGDSQEQSSEQSSEKPSTLGAFLSNQGPSQQGRSNDSQGGSKSSGSGSKKPKAITSGSGEPSVDKQVEEGDTAGAATSSDPKTQGNNKDKNKQKAPKVSPLAHFQNTQGKVEDKKPLSFTTELERIEKCADNNFYGILGFPSDSNDVDLTIRTQRYMRLTQLIHSDKIEEKFKTRANGATQSKMELYGMLGFTEC